MSLLTALCRTRLRPSNLGTLYRLHPEISYYRCNSSSSVLQLDPLVAEVLKTPGRRLSKSLPANPVDLAKADLPPADEWRTCFPYSYMVKNRVMLQNPETASHIANAFVPRGSKGKIVIEAFPGPGQLTRALLKLPKERIKKIIVLEDFETYLEYLRPLEHLDSRVKIVPKNGAEWASYKDLHNLELLSDVSTVPWQDGIHPQLQFISHLSANVYGEQFLSQLFRSIPDQQWLFQYGRVPLNFILSERVWKRVTAGLHDSGRCKLSVIAEAAACCSGSLPLSMTSPYGDHFYPPSNASHHYQKGVTVPPGARRTGVPFQATQIIPLQNQAIKKGQLDKWDYCLRRLFVKKATPLASALPVLGPGAQSLLKQITNPDLPESERMGNVKKLVREMTVEDWTVLVDAFDRWPFAPVDLGISQSFTHS